MMVRIDDEAEPADIVFGGWDEKAPLLGAGAAFAARRGDTLDEPFVLLWRPVRGWS